LSVWRRGVGLLLAVVVVTALAAADPDGDRWWQPGQGRTFGAQLDYTDTTGVVRNLLHNGPLVTRGHPFFEPIGGNGRACVTCHQPADAMSLAASSARARWETAGAADPLFAAIDGSNCPTLPQGERTSHSLILDYGLIRIERPWPPRDAGGRAIPTDFDIEVVRDPYGCNTGPHYGPTARSAVISVYRRPRPATNLKYLLAVGFAYDPKRGIALPRDPATGMMISGNLMADARAGTLEAQALDAARTHLGLTRELSPTELAGIVDFESNVYSAQYIDRNGGLLDADGAYGGPGHLEESKPGQLGSIGRAVWSEFGTWEGGGNGTSSPEQKAFRESVARGARVFRDRTFLISDSAGINSPIGFGNPVRNSCVFCHNMSQMGNDVAPGQVDLGTTNEPFADPLPHLPLFRIRCRGAPHPHYGPVIYTHDPGYALTTGRCADVGKITLQSMRGLAARAPYFSNGSAKDLRAVVDFYDRRYDIGYTEQEKQDLVNLMSVL
jgi:hypothetical protein